MKKKIIDFHIESYRNIVIGGNVQHVSAAHNISREQFDSYNLYRDYCIRLGITYVEEEMWNEAFPDKKREVFEERPMIIEKEEIPQ